MELRTLLIRDAAGRITGMWAIIRDITRRKRAEEIKDVRQTGLLKQVAFEQNLNAPLPLDTVSRYVGDGLSRLLERALDGGTGRNQLNKGGDQPKGSIVELVQTALFASLTRSRSPAKSCLSSTITRWPARRLRTYTLQSSA